MWKIVATDNYGRESRPETLVAEHIKNRQDARTMAKALNNIYCVGEYAPTYYKVTPQSYDLWRGMAEFVDEPSPFNIKGWDLT